MFQEFTASLLFSSNTVKILRFLVLGKVNNFIVNLKVISQWNDWCWDDFVIPALRQFLEFSKTSDKWEVRFWVGAGRSVLSPSGSFCVNTETSQVQITISKYMSVLLN